MSNDSLACTYAALMLHDAGVTPTADAIAKSCENAGLEVRPTMPILFARFLEKKSIEQLVAAAASAAAPEAPAAAAAPAAGGDKKAAAAAEEEEEDDDFGMGGLF